MAERPLVSISHLSKSYRRGEQVVPVLNDITLSIAEGDFMALMGPSGSGKSTLLNLIAGIDKPDSGELLVGGEDLTRLGADEPTGDLDRKSAEDVLGLLRRLNSEMGKTIVMVSHDAHAVQSARHVMHLEKGELMNEINGVRDEIPREIRP